jgi:hypothetical protein
MGVKAPGYHARHMALRRARGRAADSSCVECGKPGQEWAQIHESSGMDFWDDYVPMCRRCHLDYDYDPRARSLASVKGWHTRRDTLQVTYH